MFRVAKSCQADAEDQLTMRQKTPSFDRGTRLIFLVLLLICELIGSRCIAWGQKSEIQVIYNDIYLKERTGDLRRLTRDGKPKENAILSPSGRQVAYNRPWTAYGKEPKPPVFVVLSTETGEILKEIPVDWVARYIANAAWIDDRFLMVSGEGIFFVVLDSHAGEQTHSLFGGGFRLSPDRKKIVFVKGRVPLYGNTPPQYESDKLMLALVRRERGSSASTMNARARAIYPELRPWGVYEDKRYTDLTDRHHVKSEIVWRSDSQRLAFVEQHREAFWLLLSTITVKDGQVEVVPTRFRLAERLAEVKKLEWIAEQDAIKVSTVDSTFLVDLKDGKVNVREPN